LPQISAIEQIRKNWGYTFNTRRAPRTPPSSSAECVGTCSSLLPTRQRPKREKEKAFPSVSCLSTAFYYTQTSGPVPAISYFTDFPYRNNRPPSPNVVAHYTLMNRPSPRIWLCVAIPALHLSKTPEVDIMKQPCAKSLPITYQAVNKPMRCVTLTVDLQNWPTLPGSHTMAKPTAVRQQRSRVQNLQVPEPTLENRCTASIIVLSNEVSDYLSQLRPSRLHVLPLSLIQQFYRTPELATVVPPQLTSNCGSW
jgi:hypothetical protein